MSMEGADREVPASGTPELAPVGKRIEMLRIECGMSKQQLAKAAGISRQQFWRVLAGKSELTSSLRERLAAVLHTEVSVLQHSQPSVLGASSLGRWFSGAQAAVIESGQATAVAERIPAMPPATFAEFAGSVGHVRAVLANVPGCDAGVALRRSILDAIEDVAVARGVALPAEFFELRRAVITRAT